jgi:hypothetical protein
MKHGRNVGPAVLLAALLFGAGAGERAGGGRAAGATRADLDAVRRSVSQLESEYALGSTRKPYFVLDLAARTLRCRLMGMTLREIPVAAVETRGLEAATSSVPAGPTSVAGIFTLKEKEGDPRLSPLTPEQIEAGLDDENAADVLPPEAPAHFALSFRQPLLVRIEGTSGSGGVGGILPALGAWWRGLWSGARRTGEAAPVLSLALHLDQAAARDLYRSLVPGERWLIVPPAGLLLPAVGQEPTRGLRPARPAPAPTPAAPPGGAPGVPFQIPPPVPAPADEPSTPSAAPVAPPEGEPAPTATPSPSANEGDGAGGSGEESDQPAPAERLPEPPGA